MNSSIEVDGRVIALSSLDKVLFPDSGITKGDLVTYYLRIAEAMLPHVHDRPANLQRFPGGIRSGFFQQDASDHFPDWIRTVEVHRRGQDGTVHHVVCDDTATLVYLANQNTVTFHVWPSRSAHLHQPDRLVFDLDPAGEEQLDLARDAARILRRTLQELGLTAFLQTSGSRGFHIVAPLVPAAGFDEVREFAARVAQRAADEAPDDLTVEHRKAKRRGRLYLDINRNGYAQTLVAPYSVRARPGAPVATPLDWHELSRVQPRDYTIRNVLRRLGQKPDPWARMQDHAAPLPDARGRLSAP